jgi:hypothetical protein
MRRTALYVSAAVLALLCSPELLRGRRNPAELQPEFHTSDRCLACHNGVTAPNGVDISIGFDWRASIMANSSRDPYWQASVRRETLDHPQAKPTVEDECSICHMPITRYEAMLQGEKGQIFSHLPFDQNKKQSAQAADGVTCSVCHQIGKEKLGTDASFNGGFVVDTPKSKTDHPEYGPYQIDPGRTRIMDTSTGGFQPTQASHIRESDLCGTCHTLYTTALGADGKEIGRFPEQMPYLEWRHSSYREKYSCQWCHMPVVQGNAPIVSVLPQPRAEVHQHVFVGGNFLMEQMLNLYRTDLDVAAMPTELTSAAERTAAFLQSQTARVRIRSVDVIGGKVQADVFVRI